MLPPTQELKSKYGLGRTGRFLASECWPRRPDAVVLGKHLGGGLLPISAMLTRAEVISRPDVDSARSTERVIACEAAARSTMMPLRMPSEGSMPTPRMRMDL